MRHASIFLPHSHTTEEIISVPDFLLLLTFRVGLAQGLAKWQFCLSWSHISKPKIFLFLVLYSSPYCLPQITYTCYITVLLNSILLIYYDFHEYMCVYPNMNILKEMCWYFKKIMTFFGHVILWHFPLKGLKNSPLKAMITSFDWFVVNLYLEHIYFPDFMFVKVNLLRR